MPGLWSYRLALGRYRLMAGDYEEAKNVLEVLLRENGAVAGRGSYSDALAQAYVGLGRDEEAVALLRATHSYQRKEDGWFQERMEVLLNAVQKRAAWLRERRSVEGER